MKTTHYFDVKIRLKAGEPEDFKIIDGDQERFKKGVVFYRRDKQGDFYGPFVTGELYDPFDVKNMLDQNDIFISTEKNFD